MATKANEEACGCITKGNKLLAEEQIKLDAVVTYGTSNCPVTRVCVSVVPIAGVKHKRGWRPKLIVASYCPFCGKEYLDAKQEGRAGYAIRHLV
jgi:hypothetical protein